MSRVLIISTGKEKNPYLPQELNYLKRMGKIKVKVLNLPQEKTIELEARKVLKALPEKTLPILLTEQGKQKSSLELSQFIFKFPHITFIVAGAFGPALILKERCSQEFSLSELTFPHQLARFILIEQLYRSEQIFLGHPYHHGQD